MSAKRFREVIQSHYEKKGRHDLPWRKTKDPYRILVSEIMLQQTQVPRVMRFYPNFIKKFPDFGALARAKTRAVLRAWQGMGYNRRALNLQKLSRIVLEKFNGRLPHEREALEKLPGIGKTTAGAVRAFAWNEHGLFVETNIRRVFIHFFFGGRRRVTDREIERYIRSTLPRENFREWYWALMDYGAMLSRRKPRGANPNRKSTHYKKQTKFSGSNRELRGKMLRILLLRKKIPLAPLVRTMGKSPGRVKKVIRELVRDGFIKQRANSISIA